MFGAHEEKDRHLDRYVQEFSGKYNIRGSGTRADAGHGRQAERAATFLPDLIAHNGLCSMGR